MCMHSIEWAKALPSAPTQYGHRCKVLVSYMVCWRTRGMHGLWWPGMNAEVPKCPPCTGTAEVTRRDWYPHMSSGDSCLCSLAKAPKTFLGAVFCLVTDSEAKARARSRRTLLLAHGSCCLWASQLLAIPLCRLPLPGLPRGPQVPALNSANLLPMGTVSAKHSMPEPPFL